LSTSSFSSVSGVAESVRVLERWMVRGIAEKEPTKPSTPTEMMTTETMTSTRDTPRGRLRARMKEV
jgi:hypothetical protein